MKIENLPNEMKRLTPEAPATRIVEHRTGMNYSEAVCKSADVKYFSEI